MKGYREMQRRGTTLIEVLVAIFIMGIGLIAILALFPLGVLRMAQAIQDDRTGHIAMNAEAIATLKNIRDYQTLFPPGDAFSKPGGVFFQDADPNGPSYPVFIDPIGFRGSGGNQWLGVGNSIPRRSVSWVEPTNPTGAIRWFSFLDDILFDTNGLPNFITPGVFEREPRYSWAYLLQRPRTADLSVVNLAAVVFNRRPLSLNQNFDLNEFSYDNAIFDLARNVVTVDSKNNPTNTPPPVRPGNWILDATIVTNPPSAHGYFYRVVGVNDIDATTVEFEVQTPFRGFLNSTIPPFIAGNPFLYQGRVIVLEGVVEVFEKGNGRLP